MGQMSGLSKANARRKNSAARKARRSRSFARSIVRKEWNEDHGHGHRKAKTFGRMMRLRNAIAKGSLVEYANPPKLDETPRPKLYNK